MKYGAQTDVLRMIPGLENASFARLGGIRRNAFLNSPTLLDAQLRLRSKPHIRFAGQITGVEGYVESAAMGLLAGRLAAADMLGQPLSPPPQDSAMGALIHHITGGADAKTFQPMNVTFGLFRPVDGLKGGRRDSPANRRSRSLSRAPRMGGADQRRSHLAGPHLGAGYLAPVRPPSPLPRCPATLMGYGPPLPLHTDPRRNPRRGERPSRRRRRAGRPDLPRHTSPPDAPRGAHAQHRAAP